MRGLWLFNIVSLLSVVSPPVLLALAWTRFLNRTREQPQAKWRLVSGAINLSAVSVLLAICVVKFLGNKCNADAGNWSCVIAWRSLTGWVVRTAPFFLVLAVCGPKRTRILTFVSVLAIVLDVILVDMTA